MQKQTAFQQLRRTIQRRKTLASEIAPATAPRQALTYLRTGLAQAEAEIIAFRNFMLEVEDHACSERELLAANKAMVLRAEYRKLACVDTVSEYHDLVFEAEVLEDQFLILAKGV